MDQGERQRPAVRPVAHHPATVTLALFLAFSTAACTTGPILGPTDFSDQFARYTGTWRGTVNGLEVVLDMRAGPGFGGPGLSGTGTATEPATGDIHPLTISGLAPESSPSFNLFTPVTSGSGMSIDRHTGSFAGSVSGDGRTWPGHFTATRRDDGAPIFGPGEYSVTLIKQ